MSYDITGDTFQAEVLESEQPVLLDFWAAWCGPCQMVSPILDEVIAQRPDVKLCKVNVDENPELAIQFGVMSIPTLVVMKDGQLVNKAVGVQSKDAILKML